MTKDKSMRDPIVNLTINDAQQNSERQIEAIF